ncbi:MAG: cob(I)yrinic acid a,c-diamide adenosyltransferase [Nanoarchaeota archaeon]|nr:cob(I)yrinic acid a,c-diamide adenosyltransferase [Nanoarchaeota archaeon]
MEQDRLGLVHVYTGNGKGKTTASLGLSLRAIGHGFRVYMAQFLKGGFYTGEFVASQNILKNLDITQFGKACLKLKKQMRIRPGKPPIFVREDNVCGDCRFCFLPEDDEMLKIKEAFRQAKKAAMKGDYDMVILDEINVVLHKGLLPMQEALDLIKDKHPETELVFTGRNAPKEIRDVADYVSEVHEIKHPWQQGIQARKGIEY